MPKFVAAPVEPIPRDKQHEYLYDPKKQGCAFCNLPRRNKRIHKPSDQTRAQWVEFDEARYR